MIKTSKAEEELANDERVVERFRFMWQAIAIGIISLLLLCVLLSLAAART